MLRLRFNAVLTQFDLFDNVITQRSENQTGVWLSGLDVASADALQLHRKFFEAPPIICYLDRGTGAAIRRARTRLPGGGSNPVAIIRVPRERMVGSGIASSVFHEVGHQAAALLGLVESLRPELRAMARSHPQDARSLGTVGALDLRDRRRLLVGRARRRCRDHGPDGRRQPAARVCLPAGCSRSSPHAVDPRQAQRCTWAVPCIRMPIWGELIDLWDSYYPPQGLDPHLLDTICTCSSARFPTLVTLLLHHRPAALQGRSLLEVLDLHELQPGAPSQPTAALAQRASGNVQGPSHPGFRRDRSGPRRRQDHPRGGKPGTRQTPHALGSHQHPRSGCRLHQRRFAPPTKTCIASNTINRFQPQRGDHHGRFNENREGCIRGVVTANGKACRGNPRSRGSTSGGNISVGRAETIRSASRLLRVTTTQRDAIEFNTCPTALHRWYAAPSSSSSTADTVALRNSRSGVKRPNRFSRFPSVTFQLRKREKDTRTTVCHAVVGEPVIAQLSNPPSRPLKVEIWAAAGCQRGRKRRRSGNSVSDVPEPSS